MLGEMTWRHSGPDLKGKTCSFPSHELVLKGFKRDPWKNNLLKNIKSNADANSSSETCHVDLLKHVFTSALVFSKFF